MLSVAALLPAYVETNCFMAALSHTVLPGNQHSGFAAGRRHMGENRKMYDHCLGLLAS